MRKVKEGKKYMKDKYKERKGKEINSQNLWKIW